MRTKRQKRPIQDIMDNFNKKQIELSLYHSLMELIRSDYDVNLMFMKTLISINYPYNETEIKRIDSDIDTKPLYTTNISFYIGRSFNKKFVNVQINENTKKFRFDWLNWITK